MIALITPTGGRPEQIQLCAKFMHRQDYMGEVLWIIVDDVDPSTTDFITDDFKEGWRIVKLRPEPRWKSGMNTQSRNMLVGLENIKGRQLEAIFIIEDDDYYKPKYLRVMMDKLQGFDLAGETCTIYYNVNNQLIFYNQNTLHASLFQVGFVPALIPSFEKICVAQGGFLDVRLFKVAHFEGRKINLFNTEHLSIGIKGMPGRYGIGFGHKMGAGRYSLKRMTHDKDGVKLKEILGDDYVFYHN